ncbi:MAG TPA: alpha/beta hydrolase [Acidimicrobiales bacterium]|nr:alpha/beta hydrolase [Acidimicrobiales bacterium]
MADPAILLLHGFSSSSEASWARNGWLDILADTGRRVIAPDLLGHGEAAKPHDPAAYAAMEPDVHDLVADVGDVDVVGFSMGARLALCVEAMFPGTFGRIVAGGVGANLFGERNPSSIADALEGTGEALDPLGRAFVAAAHQPPNDALAMAACLRREQPPLGPAELARVRCPVLVVVGDKDTVAMPPDQLVDALPDARLAMVKGADHLGTMKGFGFLEAALGFLDALPA